ncbi:hypothetical protein AAG570_006782 [Ranatra chinensis]|uniref:Mitochondrial carrier protein n=1 Tax=Ranatra chinensis TaxID=642074 RepID=A0ABD0YV24_9HEMI
MTQTQRDTVIHLVAGGIAGTVGAVVTCPLEVVKTRLQSSSSSGFSVCLPKIASPEGTSRHVTCKTILPSHQRRRINTVTSRHATQILAISTCGIPKSQTAGLLQCLRLIIQNEGPKALFRGLGPNLVGVAPSRAIYFCAYSQAKSFFNSLINPDTAAVHVLSASCAGRKLIILFPN